jgi:hypothetical protein
LNSLQLIQQLGATPLPICLKLLQLQLVTALLTKLHVMLFRLGPRARPQQQHHHHYSQGSEGKDL